MIISKFMSFERKESNNKIHRSTFIIKIAILNYKIENFQPILLDFNFHPRFLVRVTMQTTMCIDFACSHACNGVLKMDTWNILFLIIIRCVLQYFPIVTLTHYFWVKGKNLAFCDDLFPSYTTRIQSRFLNIYFMDKSYLNPQIVSRLVVDLEKIIIGTHNIGQDYCANYPVILYGSLGLLSPSNN